VISKLLTYGFANQGWSLGWPQSKRFSLFARQSIIIDEERRRGCIDSLAIPLYNLCIALTGLEGTPNRESIASFLFVVTVHQITPYFALLRIVFAVVGDVEG
jgi:hypothetical protein